MHRVTHSLGLGGYGILMAELVGIRELLYLPAWVGSSGLLVLFYGVYFGVLNRDCAEAVTDRIHLRMGVRCSPPARRTADPHRASSPPTLRGAQYISRKRDDDGGAAGAYVPYNLCALCGKELRALMAESEGDTSHTEQLVKLNCSHECARRTLLGLGCTKRKRTAACRLTPAPLPQVPRVLHPGLGHGWEARHVPHLWGEGVLYGRAGVVAVEEAGGSPRPAPGATCGGGPVASPSPTWPPRHRA